MKISKKNLPQHIAIILDGNGRWAKKQNLPRTEGHKQGGENLRKLIDVIIKLKIPFVSLYVFSTENWKRPKNEVVSLWQLMYDFFSKYLNECMKKGIQIKISGDVTKLPLKNQEIIRKVVNETKNNKKLVANFCINYGSQQEIVNTCNALIEKKVKEFQQKKKIKKATLKDFEKSLSTYPLPPVDLLIRPGGEVRISNFLLWQLAYAELYFTEVLWPDFSEEDLLKAIEWFSRRKRRFGGI